MCEHNLVGSELHNCTTRYAHGLGAKLQTIVYREAFLGAVSLR